MNSVSFSTAAPWPESVRWILFRVLHHYISYKFWSAVLNIIIILLCHIQDLLYTGRVAVSEEGPQLWKFIGQGGDNMYIGTGAGECEERERERRRSTDSTIIGRFENFRIGIDFDSFWWFIWFYLIFRQYLSLFPYHTSHKSHLRRRNR